MAAQSYRYQGVTNALSMITLFGKLKEDEHEINRFKSSEEDSKKKEGSILH